MNNPNDHLDDSVVSGSTNCLTANAKWICINNIYAKLNRPNVHSVGLTHTDNTVDHWFSFRVEIVGDIYLLHLFMTNDKQRDFTISLSENSIVNKNKDVYLSQKLQNFQFSDTVAKLPLYVTTYHFSHIDVEIFKNKKLYVHMKFIENTTENDVEKTDLAVRVKLSHDFYNLFKDPINSDFIIESGDGYQFHVHQTILANQSEVFYAMLKEYTAEKQKGYVKLFDVNKEDLSNLLEFIYSGTIKDLVNCNYINVYMLADRYNLIDLTFLVEHALCEAITVDNAIETLNNSVFCNSHFIKTYIMKFIKQHQSLFKSESWSVLHNMDLLKEIMVFLQE